jgi:hypothetical protein
MGRHPGVSAQFRSRISTSPISIGNRSESPTQYVVCRKNGFGIRQKPIFAATGKDWWSLWHPSHSRNTRRRTAIANPSTASCATNASTRRSFTASRKLRSSSSNGSPARSSPRARSASMAQSIQHDPPTLIARISATCAGDIHRPITQFGSLCSNPVISICLVQNIRQVTLVLILSCFRPKVAIPMFSNIDAAAEPYAVALADMVEQLDQPCASSWTSDKAIMQPDREELRRAPVPFS